MLGYYYRVVPARVKGYEVDGQSFQTHLQHVIAFGMQHMRSPAARATANKHDIKITRRMQRIMGERERGTVHGGRIRLLPPEINWAHRMLSQSSASSLLCWSGTHWLKCVASVISDVPLMGSHIEGGELGFN